MQAAPAVPSGDEAASKDSNSQDSTAAISATTSAKPGTPASNKDLLVAIGFTGLLGALEATITSTALPTIIADLSGGDLYIWAVNCYFLAMTSFQPMYGQLTNDFGRRWPTIGATADFLLGIGICGGLGAGGINVLVEIVICDLVPLRERGTYFATIFGLVASGTALGPFFGGLIVDHSTRRWVFYLNLPIGGFALLLLVVFLKVNYNREQILAMRLTSIDWAGNAIFLAATHITDGAIRDQMTSGKAYGVLSMILRRI
ncbi:Uncharacterized protein TPAR_08684 [Tolypocladium paradoxum]|uniref:Major facilitator superfamily (MFS) profile domain-containing protein n=1 Tax=Tolypocladium paradoxum TaxID=94208 RepID=A0A2S4KLI3_9HYPO|nr:Uncharacterized protein TPAR_08684 [Tolypocladium paradoxum]